MKWRFCSLALLAAPFLFLAYHKLGMLMLDAPALDLIGVRTSGVTLAEYQGQLRGFMALGFVSTIAIAAPGTFLIEKWLASVAARSDRAFEA